MADEFVELDRVSAETWRELIELNLSSHFYFLRSFLSFVCSARNSRSVTLISSINAIEPFGLIPYSCAKAGLFG